MLLLLALLGSYSIQQFVEMEVLGGAAAEDDAVVAIRSSFSSSAVAVREVPRL